MVATTLAVFFYGLLLQQKCLADGIYGYFAYNIKTFRCATEPDPNGLCRFNREVGNLSENLQLDKGMAQTIVQCKRFSDIENHQLLCEKRNYKVRLHLYGNVN